MSWGAVGGAAVSVVGGAMMSKNKGNGDGGGGGNAISPWYSGGGASQASTMLQQLMAGGPQSILDDKAFKQSNQFAMDATQRQLAAGGQHLSGNEAIALNDTAQRNAMGFYNQQVQQLGNLAGAGQSLAGGVNANSNAWQAGNANEQAGWGNVASGIGGLASLYGSGSFNSNGTTPSNNNGYDPTQLAELSKMEGYS